MAEQKKGTGEPGWTPAEKSPDPAGQAAKGGDDTGRPTGEAEPKGRPTGDREATETAAARTERGAKR
jgi:hypothetical protein